ncbi:MAG: GGDEF domain-containing protein [Solirubrobacterales bacterium]
MAVPRNIFRSSRAGLRRASQFLPALLTVALFVLGPMALVAYACSGGGGHSSHHSGGPHTSGGGVGGGSGGWHGGSDSHSGGWGGSGQGPGTPGPGSPGSGSSAGAGSGAGSGSGSAGPGTSGSGSSGSGSGSGGGTGNGTGGGSASGSGSGTGTSGSGSGSGSGTVSNPSSEGSVDGTGGESTGSDGSSAPSTGSPAAPTPTGGVVEEGGAGDDGSKGSSGSGSGSGSGEAKPPSTSGSLSGGVAGIASSVAQPATATIVSSIGLGGGDNNSSRGSSSGSKKSGSGARDELTQRTTIARAVDGIPLAFRAAFLLLIFASSVLAVISFRERRRATGIARVAQLDHLTGLANREGFDRQMSIEWQRALRHDRPLGLVFADLDNFKSFNDTNGHVAGDRLLRGIAAAITETARGSDFTARLGGDEFVVICPDTDEAGLQRLVERLRVEAAGLDVSLSIGAAARREDDESPDQLVHRADVAMYQAKGGRRRGISSANPMLGSMRRS